MISNQVLIVLFLTGIIGGFIAGLGGPGGIPVILVLNFAIIQSPGPIAATASSIFFFATIVATGLYYYSDDIDWGLVAVIGIPALVGSHIGTMISTYLSVQLFEYILNGVLFFASAGIWYENNRGHSKKKPTETERGNHTTNGIIIISSFAIGVLAGITGIGGPALTIPLLILLGINPVTAIGAGLASGIIITSNTVIGHVIQGNSPIPALLLIVGIPYAISQFLGWKYVHSVSETVVSYSIATLAVTGSIIILIT